ncbi:MAG: FIST C-terminal domain-containing protein [Eudoraea sp.]|nr:FIST C-terminal domain-containing protein [Eudoraea sp.]
MKSKSINAGSTGDFKIALQKAMSDGFAPTLAVVFLSVKQDREEICGLFRMEGIDMIGATSSGEFIEGHESIGGIVALLLDLNKSHYRIVLEEIGINTLAEASHALLKKAKQAFSNPAFILLSTYHSESGQIIDGEQLIRCLEAGSGPKLTLFGGMAGDDITFEGTFVFTNDQVTDHGVAALVLDENKVSLRGMAMSGWKPIGISRTITKSEGNLVYTIDNQPALETYLRFLGIDPSSIEDQIGFFNTEGIHYPLQIEREGRTPIMCNPTGYDEEKGALICESQISEGSAFRFSTPPDFDIVETILQKGGELQEKTGAEAEALLIFSCAGRLSALGPLAQQENDGLQEIWKVPMAGFYTYGEFGRSLNGKHEFHSTTNSWVVLNEK